MESKNPLVKLVTFGKIKRMITSYTGHKLKTIDQRLLRGLFMKKLKDFDEDYRSTMESKSLFERLKFEWFSDYIDRGGRGGKQLSVLDSGDREFDKNSIAGGGMELGGRHYDDLFTYSNRHLQEDRASS